MDQIFQYLAAIFIRMGGPGLLILGIFDSSFLFMPLGNDLLVIAMSARNRHLMLYYALMSTIGSVIGTFLVDVISRKGGEEGLERYLSPRRIEYVKRKVKKNAGWALALASLAPPPFPFTPFVIATAALQYPRKWLLINIAITRMIRFCACGLLALVFGERILRWAKLPAVWYGVLVLVVVSTVGSAWSIYNWIKRSRTAVVR